MDLSIWRALQSQKFLDRKLTQTHIVKSQLPPLHLHNQAICSVQQLPRNHKHLAVSSGELRSRPRRAEGLLGAHRNQRKQAASLTPRPHNQCNRVHSSVFLNQAVACSEAVIHNRPRQEAYLGEGRRNRHRQAACSGAGAHRQHSQVVCLVVETHRRHNQEACLGVAIRSQHNQEVYSEVACHNQREQEDCLITPARQDNQAGSLHLGLHKLHPFSDLLNRHSSPALLETRTRLPHPSGHLS